jgi:KaiC/GvpD/RAD55 family RecA-like ATPase
MIAKTLSGISVVDEAFGGIFSNRSFLVCGPASAGKTVLGLRFTQQGLQQNERCLYLSTMLASDLSILAESLGFDLSPAIDSSGLTLLEYESFIHGNGTPGLDMLPPEGFDQLRDIIHANSIERVVLDTVLPWVSVKQPDRMSEQIFSFTRSFDRLGVTTMLTLPKPVSNMSFRLKKAIEDVVPISILLGQETENEAASLQVVKYLGEKKLGGKTYYRISDGTPITEKDFEKPEPEELPASNSSLKSPPKQKQSDSSQDQARPRPRFASFPIESHKAQAGSSEKPTKAAFRETPIIEKKYEEYTGEVKRSSPRFAAQEPENEFREEEPKAARLSSIWKPKPSNSSHPSDSHH